MFCTAASNYLTLLPFYQNKSRSTFKISSLIIFKSQHGSNLQIWKPFISTVLNFTKTDIPAALQDSKEIPMRHLILNAYKSRKSCQLSVPKWIYLATTIPTLTILGVGIIAVFYKCKKKSAKIYRLARKR